ncbi:hypothetical protein CR513_18202, partial [Mucuna pruriens]
MIAEYQHVKVKVAPWGHFVNTEKLDYLGYDSTWKCDLKRWSYFEIIDILRDMRYQSVLEMSYFVGGLKALVDNNGTMEMINIANVQGKVYLFILHPISQPNIIDNMGNKLGMDGVGQKNGFGVGGSCKENGPIVGGSYKGNGLGMGRSCKGNGLDVGRSGKENEFVVGIVVEASWIDVDKKKASLANEATEVNVDGAGKENGPIVGGATEVNGSYVNDATKGSGHKKDSDPIHEDENSDNDSEDQSHNVDSDAKDNDSDSDYNPEHIFFDGSDEKTNGADIFEVYASCVKHKDLDEDEFQGFAEVD